MKIPDEVINRATAAALKGVMTESNLTQKTWAAAAGMSEVTVQKLLSGNQAVKVPQFLALANALENFTPEEVMERVDRAVKRAVSEMPISLDTHRKKKSPSEMTDDEIDQLQGAANRDVELEQDDPPTT